MILRTKYCPFCDKVFYSSPIQKGKEELLIHIKEHHHIVTERYYKISAALNIYEDIINLTNVMIKTNTDCIEDIRKIRNDIKYSQIFEFDEI